MVEANQISEIPNEEINKSIPYLWAQRQAQIQKTNICEPMHILIIIIIGGLTGWQRKFRAWEGGNISIDLEEFPCCLHMLQQAERLCKKKLLLCKGSSDLAHPSVKIEI